MNIILNGEIPYLRYAMYNDNLFLTIAP